MREDLASVFTERLVARIAKCNLTNAELARAINVSVAYIGQMCNPERGKLPSADVLVHLATALSTSCDYLLGLTDDPSPPTRDQLRLPRARVEAALEDVTSAAEHLRSALFEETSRASTERAPRDVDDAALDILLSLSTETPAAAARRLAGEQRCRPGKDNQANGT